MGQLVREGTVPLYDGKYVDMAEVAAALVPGKESKDSATLLSARTELAGYKAKREKLRYEKEAGLLVPIEDVREQGWKAGRAVRDGIMGIPAKEAERLADIDDPIEMKAVLTEILAAKLTEVVEARP